MFNKKIASSLLAIMLVAAVQQGASADEVKHYSIKQSKPSVGTNMTKEIVKAGTVPLNKTYGELTTEQKNSIKAEYDNMPEGDEPPFPVKGLNPIYRAIGYAHENLELQYKGSLTLYVLVDGEGNPKSVDVMNSPNEDISKAATFALMSQKYKPAVCSGQPCAMKLPIHAELVGPEVDTLSTFNAPGVLVSPH